MRRMFICLLIAGLLPAIGFGATRPKTRTTRKPVASSSRKKPVSKRISKRKRPAKPMPAVDPTLGDNVDGDDLNIRRAAVAALGGYNGSVVVVDPRTGRVLTIVNQKLAFSSGFIPCSTIKLVTALAALSE